MSAQVVMEEVIQLRQERFNLEEKLRKILSENYELRMQRDIALHTLSQIRFVLDMKDTK